MQKWVTTDIFVLHTRLQEEQCEAESSEVQELIRKDPNEDMKMIGRLTRMNIVRQRARR